MRGLTLALGNAGIHCDSEEMGILTDIIQALGAGCDPGELRRRLTLVTDALNITGDGGGEEDDAGEHMQDHA